MSKNLLVSSFAFLLFFASLLCEDFLVLTFSKVSKSAIAGKADNRVLQISDSLAFFETPRTETQIDLEF